MIEVIDGGKNMFDAFAYATPSNRDIAFFEHNKQSLFSNPNPFSGGFFDMIKEKVLSYDYSKINQYATQIKTKIQNFWDFDVIRPLDSLIAIQFAPQNMIKYLMANPTVRALYHKGLVAGYDDLYKDAQPTAIKDNHHDYKVVMQGAEQTDPETQLPFWTTYCNDFTEPEMDLDKLTHREQLDIQTTWGWMDYYLSLNKEDPTSQYSGML